MRVPFLKMQGNGNDFVLVDEYKSPVPEEKKAAFARRCCDRRFGVGADGVLFFAKPLHAPLRLRIFNADGSEAEMCGNGIRCFVKYALDEGHMKPGKARVETQAGVLDVEARQEGGRTLVKVNMGKPLFDVAKIPMDRKGGDFIDMPLHGCLVSAVNTGVPHAVVFVDDVDAVDLTKVAPPIRYDKIFPHGANVDFVQREAGGLKVRTYERGVEGETLSCGTGSVAAAAVARRRGFVRDATVVRTRGGDLLVSFVADIAFMEGPAETVFSGEIDVDFTAL